MTAAMPYAHLGEALATDYLLVREQFSDEESYEGTETIQTLIVGRDITGVAAFA